MLYIYAKGNLTEIVCNDKTQEAFKSTLSIVKGLCKRELFAYESRISYTKQLLNIKSKIPIYVNEKVLLMPTNASKSYNTYWINYYEVFSYERYFNKTLILFYNLKELCLNISLNSFSKMMEKGKTIDEYFKKRLTHPSI